VPVCVLGDLESRYLCKANPLDFALPLDFTDVIHETLVSGESVTVIFERITKKTPTTAIFHIISI